ncbi:hypothetical protein HDU76_007307, partial [Blyttiomyces sp. JEL0837]
MGRNSKEIVELGGKMSALRDAGGGGSNGSIVKDSDPRLNDVIGRSNQQQEQITRLETIVNGMVSKMEEVKMMVTNSDAGKSNARDDKPDSTKVVDSKVDQLAAIVQQQSKQIGHLLQTVGFLHSRVEVTGFSGGILPVVSDSFQMKPASGVNAVGYLVEQNTSNTLALASPYLPPQAQQNVPVDHSKPHPVAVSHPIMAQEGIPSKSTALPPGQQKPTSDSGASSRQHNPATRNPSQQYDSTELMPAPSKPPAHQMPPVGSFYASVKKKTLPEAPIVPAPSEHPFSQPSPNIAKTSKNVESRSEPRPRSIQAYDHQQKQKARQHFSSPQTRPTSAQGSSPTVKAASPIITESGIEDGPQAKTTDGILKRRAGDDE